LEEVFKKKRHKKEIRKKNVWFDEKSKKKWMKKL